MIEYTYLLLLLLVKGTYLNKVYNISTLYKLHYYLNSFNIKFLILEILVFKL